MYVGFDDRASAVSPTMNTPKLAAGDMARTSLTVTLVSARGSSVFVVAGRVVTREGLALELSRVAAQGGSSRPILIKADASLTMQSFLDVCELARKAGFPGVLVAADER
jgi:biopolymer transport protein ExbD